MIEHDASSCKGSQLPITIYLLFWKIYEKSLLQNLTIFIFVCHAAGMLQHERKTSIEGCQKVFCHLCAQILLTDCPKTSNWHLLGIPVTASSVTVKLLEQNQRESEAPTHSDYQLAVYLAFPHIPCLSLDASSTSFSSSHISFCLLYLSAIIVFLYYNFLIFLFLSLLVPLH